MSDEMMLRFEALRLLRPGLVEVAKGMPIVWSDELLEEVLEIRKGMGVDRLNLRHEVEAATAVEPADDASDDPDAGQRSPEVVLINPPPQRWLVLEDVFVSARLHPAGGVVFPASMTRGELVELLRARAAAPEAYDGYQDASPEDLDQIVIDDTVWATRYPLEDVAVFPNAGCC